MIINKKVVLVLLFLITLSLYGCTPAGLRYHLVLNNKLVKRGEVKIVLDNGKEIMLEIMWIKGMSIHFRSIETSLNLVRKTEDIEFQYDEEKGQFIIKDEGKTFIGIPKIDVIERNGEKTYLVYSSSLFYDVSTSKELFRMTFKLGKILPPSFQFIIEEKETKKPLCNVQVQTKNWKEYQENIKRIESFKYYPLDALQKISLADGEKIDTKFKFVVGRLKGGRFRIILRITFLDPICKKYELLFKKAYIQDKSNNIYKVSSPYVYGSDDAQLDFFKIRKPPKEFSLFIPYILKESSEESVIKIDFKVDDGELEEFLKVVESKEVPEPWKSNWFGEK